MHKINDIELIKKSKNGDNIAFKTLLKKYMPMIEKKSKGFFLQGAEQEDLMQEALIGFVEAVRDFDDEKNDSFSYFLNLCITRQMQEAIKKFSRKKHSPLNSSISLDCPPPFNTEDENTRELYETLITTEKTPEEEVIYKETLAFIQGKNTLLSSLESKVLNLYLDGLSYDEIASRLNKDYKSIDNAIQRIRKKLNDGLKNFNE